MSIKAGYRITITSWENDADNYNTKVIDGLSDTDAKFVVEFIQLFYSRNAYKTKKGFGNMWEPCEVDIKEFQEAAMKVIQNHPHQTIFEVDENKYLQDHIMDYAYDLGLSCGQYYTRVLDCFKVEQVPHDIVIKDVTKQFTQG